jgi:anti-sigma B factor antagonist
MELVLRQVGHNLLVAFAERVDLEGEVSLEFKDRLKELVGDGHRFVVVDLGNVGFVDSQGLGALISCLKVLRQADGTLLLANLSESVAAVLRITRLVRVFDVHESAGDALRSLELSAAAAATPRGY